MKIAVISDTHIKNNIKPLKDFLDNLPAGIDMIIHAGDYVTLDAVKLLQAQGEFSGVWGNTDLNDVQGLLPEEIILEAASYRIAVFHGHGSSGKTADRAFSRFEGKKADIIIFGHSHQPAVFTRQGILMINPGSMFSKRRERWFSWALLELESDRVSCCLNLTSFH